MIQHGHSPLANARNYIRLVYGLPEGPGHEPPSEFRIFAYGEFNTTKGDYQFSEIDADVCIAAYCDHGNRLTIDYEHQALNDPPTGPAPAAASFVLQKRADGLYATDVRWSPRAAEMLKNKEYLYFSPAFTVGEDSHPNRLLNIALTNLPATKNMTPLVAAKQAAEENTMKTVLSALSLKDSASEAEALSAVTKLGDTMKQFIALTGKDSASEALGVLAGWKESASEVQAVRAEVAKQKADQEARDFDTEVSAAKKSGILAASDDHKRNKQALSYKGKTDALVSLRGFLGALDPLVNVASDKPAAGSEPQTAVGGVIALTDEEKRIADKFGTPHDLVLKNKARRLSLASKPVVNFEDEDAA